MSALGMRLTLHRLKRAHGVATEPVTIPMVAPTDRAQVLTGRATTVTLDLQRQK